MTDLRLFREYEPHELGGDGYPSLWHAGIDADAVYADDPDPFDYVVSRIDPTSATGIGVKDLVRMQAGYRCERCGHPYRPGCGIMSTSDKAGERDTTYWDRLVETAVAGGALQVDPKLARRTLWSACDERCTHDIDACRWRNRMGDWTTVPLNLDPNAEQQAAWRVLTVHHLNGRKHDLRWWNLAALCQRCHLHIQKKVQMERVYPFEHTDWFKIHAAGWYAYAYRGESVTREQAMANLDELLALERL